MHVTATEAAIRVAVAARTRRFGNRRGPRKALLRRLQQNDPLDHHSTRFVMPLARLRRQPTVLPRRLAQTVRAPLPVHVLQRSTGSLRAQAAVLRDALDAVISGV